MISVESLEGEVRIAVHGDLDEVNTPQLLTLLTNVGSGDRGLAIDLTPCTFIHSAGVSLIARVSREKGRPRLIVSSAGSVRKVLELCGFREWLTIVPSAPRTRYSN